MRRRESIEVREEGKKDGGRRRNLKSNARLASETRGRNLTLLLHVCHSPEKRNTTWNQGRIYHTVSILSSFNELSLLALTHIVQLSIIQGGQKQEAAKAKELANPTSPIIHHYTPPHNNSKYSSFPLFTKET